MYEGIIDTKVSVFSSIGPNGQFTQASLPNKSIGSTDYTSLNRIFGIQIYAAFAPGGQLPRSRQPRPPLKNEKQPQ
jgi:hypothetical protein